MFAPRLNKFDPPVLAPSPDEEGGGPAGVVEGLPKLNVCPAEGVVLPNRDGIADPGVAGGCAAPNNGFAGSVLLSDGFAPKLKPVDPPADAPNNDFCSPPLVVGVAPKENPVDVPPVLLPNKPPPDAPEVPNRLPEGAPVVAGF